MKRRLFSQPSPKTQDAVPFDESAIQQTLVNRFELIVDHFPDNVALSSGDQSITYRQLNEAANRLANAIIRLRGAASEPVPFLLEHGPNAIIALLGIMKAGKAYVPVDPFYPPAWITHILDDIHTDLILTNDQNIPLAMTSLAAPQTANVLNLDSLDENLPRENPNVPTTSRDIAYILYTSGSTGTPKGVIHSHEDVLQNMVAQTNDLQLQQGDRFAVFISIGFEASRFAFYGGLLNGGTVCLYDIRALGLGGLPEWIEREGITVLLSTPSTFRHTLQLMPKGKCIPGMRKIVLGGEAVTSQDISLYREHFSQSCILVNTLGMTETGVITRMKINHKSEFTGHSLPVGYPIGGKQVILGDETGQPVADGEIGEILVRSCYLSPGYWRQPSLTAERFTTDPQDEAWRIFHTGDLGVKKADGCLEHLGRKDSQIKIRGFRVDLAEIEAVLHQINGVGNSAVIARDLKHAPDNKQLVAYVEPEENARLSKKELRNHLAGKLPDYMVPTAFVLLDKLPLTPTGKVNRSSLPEPEAVGQDEEQAFVAPRAERPVILAGHGIVKAEATALLRSLVVKTGIPVAQTLLGLGGFPATHPLSLGMMGMHGEAWVNHAIQEADLLIALGMRFDDRVTGKLETYAVNAKKIHCELDPAEINKVVRADVALVGDVKDTIEALLPLVHERHHHPWMAQISEFKGDAAVRDIQQMPSNGKLYAAHVMHDLWRITEGKALVVTDVGQHQMWEAQYYKHDHPRKLVTSGGLGTMGFALPAALGARFACPDEEIWVIAGDGGFQMTACELSTIAQEGVKLNIAIINNGYLGMVRQWQQFFYNGRYSATPLKSPDFVKLAEAHGLFGLRVSTREEVAPAVMRARATRGTVLIDFRVEQEDSVYPMVPAGAALNEMIRRPSPIVETAEDD